MHFLWSWFNILHTTLGSSGFPGSLLVGIPREAHHCSGLTAESLPRHCPWRRTELPGPKGGRKRSAYLDQVGALCLFLVTPSKALGSTTEFACMSPALPRGLPANDQAHGMWGAREGVNRSWAMGAPARLRFALGLATSPHGASWEPRKRLKGFRPSLVPCLPPQVSGQKLLVHAFPCLLYPSQTFLFFFLWSDNFFFKFC